MSRSKRERTKFYILIVLVITSFIQVGVLYQNQGSPIFLWSFLRPYQVGAVGDISDYFKPYRVVASDEYMESHWIIEESYDEYISLWEDAQYYTGKILANSVISQEIYIGWGEVATKTSFIFDFKTLLRTDLLSAFLKIDASEQFELAGVYKLAIVPYDEVNNNAAVYVYDKSRVRKYVLPFNNKGLGRVDYDSIINKLQRDKNIHSYNIIKEMPILSNIEEDKLIVTRSNIYKDFSTISCNTPVIIQGAEPNTSFDMEEISKAVLGDESESYERGFDKTNDLYVFRTLSDIFRVYRDGLLEYKYVDKVERTEGIDESKSFEEAIKFIDSRKEIITGADIFLADIIDPATNKGDYYTFMFDYKIDGIPVSFNEYSAIVKDGTALSHAIVIKANSTRVLSCYWILKEFDAEGKEITLKVDTLADLLETAFKKYSGLNGKTFLIKNVSITYDIKHDLLNQSLRPVWIIDTVDGESYIVPMTEEGVS